MANTQKFASRLGMIAATVGSAVGLGNVWRFPAETQANGGAAFLLIYMACILLLGIPVMTAEFALGRGGESDASGAFERVTPKHKWWKLTGMLAILTSYLILIFYMVVSGWTLEYLIQSVTGSLYADLGDAETSLSERMAENITGTVRPIVMTLIMIAGNLLVLIRGVQKGIERMSNIMMPILFLLLVVFCGVSLTLDKAAEGLEFFLKPDFSAITSQTVINALGQAFFSLSLAMGILITYASYYPSDARLTQTAFTVSILDMLMAVLMGVIIFPGVMTFGLQDSNLVGSSLVFLTLPEIFVQMDGTCFWSSLFFLLLTVAAFTSTISIAEVSVAYMEKHFGMGRTKAVITVLAPLVVLSPMCSMSLGEWSEYTVFGMNFFDLLDTVTTNIMLPVGGILLCIYMGWVAPKSFFRSQLSNNGTLRASFFEAIYFIVKWIAPVMIALILVSQFVK